MTRYTRRTLPYNNTVQTGVTTLQLVLLLVLLVVLYHYIMMMIRSTHIPIILNRICDETTIRLALLVTADGELLGTSSASSRRMPPVLSQTLPPPLPSPESLGTLLADIAWDYQRLGEEFVLLNDSTNCCHNDMDHDDPVTTTTPTLVSQMECVFLEMEYGIVGISACNDHHHTNDHNTTTIGCFVMVIATPEAPLGWIRQRLQTVTTHIQESFRLGPSDVVGLTSTNTSTTTTTTTTDTTSDHNTTLSVT